MRRTKPIRKWTEEEVLFLKENYGKLRAEDIADRLNTTTVRVIKKATWLGLVSGKSWSKDKKYKSGHIDEYTPRLIGAITTKRDLTQYLCMYCGKIFETRPYSVEGGHTRSCGCHRPHFRKGTEFVNGTYFNRIKKNANTRKIEFNVELYYISNLLIEQGFKCKLSKRDIFCGYGKETTASLDRIESDIGYVPGNVQWVHIDVNFMKNNLDQKYFIELCKDIAINNGE